MTEPRSAAPEGGAGADLNDVLDSPEAGSTVVRGGALRIVGYTVGTLVTVGSAAALFRHLGVADAGRYVTVMSLMAVVQGLTDAGLTAIGVREYAVRTDADRRAFMRHLLGVRLTLTVLGVAAAVLFTVLAGYSQTLVIGTALAGVGTVLVAMQSALTVPLNARLRFGWVTALDLMRQVATAAAILILVALDANLLPFLAVTVPAGLLVFVVNAIVVRGDAPVVPSRDTREWMKLLRDAIAFGAATAIAAIYFRLTIVLMSLISTPTQTGYFGASFRIVDVLLVIPQLVVLTAFPIFARAAASDSARLAYGVQRVFDAMVCLGGMVAVALLLGAPIAIAIVAGPAFDGAIPVLRLQGIALIASFAAAVLGYALLSLRMHRQVLAASAAALVVNVAATFALAPSHGAQGGALATILGEVALAATGLVMLGGTGIRPPLGVVAKVGLAAGLAALFLLSPLPALAQLALGSVVYVVALLLMRAVPEEALVEVRRFLRR